MSLVLEFCFCVFQYQEDLNELNEIARHRPRSALIMNLAQENSQIRELQQENKVQLIREVPSRLYEIALFRVV